MLLHTQPPVTIVCPATLLASASCLYLSTVTLACPTIWGRIPMMSLFLEHITYVNTLQSNVVLQLGSEMLYSGSLTAPGQSELKNVAAGLPQLQYI